MRGLLSSLRASFTILAAFSTTSTALVSKPHKVAMNAKMRARTYGSGSYYGGDSSAFSAFEQCVSSCEATLKSSIGGAAPSNNASQTHMVHVGLNATNESALSYNPPFISGANPGDIVIFVFHAKNHTASLSSFSEPCTLAKDSTGMSAIYDSGFMPVSANATDLPTATFAVTDSKPSWFYCRQKTPTSHCNAGMVFAINPPPTGNTFDSFKNLALNAGPNVTAALGNSTTSGMGTPTAGGATATHTVIVAPTKGLLKFVPFAVNASVGDTIEYVWGAGPHTATKSSELAICNATLDAPFNSGLQNVSATFSTVVTDTSTQFVYCQVPSHCQKGMFSTINPNADLTSGLNQTANGTFIQTFAGALEKMMSNATVAAMVNSTKSFCANDTAAWGWGNSLSMANMPEWAMMSVVENVMTTRAFFAANPGSLNSGFDMGNINVPSVVLAAMNSSSGLNGSSYGSGANRATAFASLPLLAAIVIVGLVQALV